MRRWSGVDIAAGTGRPGPRGIRGGTAIAAIWTPEEVVIAADSADSEMDDGIERIVGTFCKIRRVGCYAFAAKGIRCGCNFDLYETVSAILEDTPELRAAIPILEAPIQNWLETVMEVPEAAHLCHLALELVVAAASGDGPMLAHLTFEANWEPPGSGRTRGITPSSTVYRSPERTERATLLLRPNKEQRNRYEEQRLASPTLEAEARGFVEFMIREGEPGVGPPVESICLTRSGFAETQR
jgi:hypothetical protein